MFKRLLFMSVLVVNISAWAADQTQQGSEQPSNQSVAQASAHEANEQSPTALPVLPVLRLDASQDQYLQWTKDFIQSYKALLPHIKAMGLSDQVQLARLFAQALLAQKAQAKKD